ncbi:hypothetical protein E4T56_gene15184 [Termitomyces sp. T112]|nr:hypothetical protein E4T56_gene15184 [Termitomyces sp. T112]
MTRCILTLIKLHFRFRVWLRDRKLRALAAIIFFTHALWDTLIAILVLNCPPPAPAREAPSFLKMILAPPPGARGAGYC